MNDFNTRKRERFLNEETYGHFVSSSNARRQNLRSLLENELPQREVDSPAYAQWTVGISNHSVELLIGQYSAGDEIASLVQPYLTALAAVEASALPHPIYKSEPFYIDSIDGYEQALWLLSLCKLLRLDALLPRLIAVFDVVHEDNRGKDALFETLIAQLGGEAAEVKPTGAMFKWLKVHPLLYQAIQAEPQKRSLYVAEFLKTWYPAMKSCYWYNRHDRVPQNFFGYWAFEAALVTYLWNIDDHGYRDLPFYPKDLVDYARAHPEINPAALAASANAAPDVGLPQGGVVGGQPCPKTGYWLTPARINSRRSFEAGEIMPDLNTDYGATIWQWDQNQQG